MNIDNIRILKKLKDKRWESYTRHNIFELDTEEKRAIESVISELETFEKIAKKLAYYTRDTKLIVKDCVGWGCTKGIECIDCIIEAARKEVEK